MGRFEIAPWSYEPAQFRAGLGLRWQAERDTAFARLPVHADSDQFPPPESAVAAALCRRTPRRPQRQTVHVEVERVPELKRKLPKMLEPGFPCCCRGALGYSLGGQINKHVAL
jgi:hypothetical protein